jgi:hypothetical protein
LQYSVLGHTGGLYSSFLRHSLSNSASSRTLSHFCFFFAPVCLPPWISPRKQIFWPVACGPGACLDRVFRRRCTCPFLFHQH